jgi:hypothetical protein
MSSARSAPAEIAVPAQDVTSWFDPERPAVERAILLTLAYADIFDYPLTVAEVHRYLVGAAAPPAAIRAALEGGRLARRSLVHHGGYVMLPGREAIVAKRQRRAAVAAKLWPRALRYGRAVARLPFVRMVAVTGALAMDNVEPEADIDFLIVTEPGRLWLCRALVIGIVRLAARWNDRLCPNYFLSEQALVIREHTLYTAHELVQMVPLAGLATYQRMRRLNPWADTFLPNADGPPRHSPAGRVPDHPANRLLEAALRTPAGGWLERWEMDRKVLKFSRQRNGAAETAFCADWCKGHFDGHGERTQAAFTDRLRAIEELAQ